MRKTVIYLDAIGNLRSCDAALSHGPGKDPSVWPGGDEAVAVRGEKGFLVS
jgi:hypothetical protein